MIAFTARSSGSPRWAPMVREPAPAAAELLDPRRKVGRLGAAARVRARSSRADARDQRLERAREHGRVGLARAGCRSSRTKLWQTTWWSAEQRRVERVGAEDRAEREHRRDRALPGRRRARSRSAARRAVPELARPGSRAACRASRRRGRARSSRSRAAAPPGAPPSPRVGEHDLRPHQPVLGFVALGQAVDPRHLGAGEGRRQRRHAAPRAPRRSPSRRRSPGHRRARPGRARGRRRSAREATRAPAPAGRGESGRLLGQLDRRLVHRPLGGQQLEALQAVAGRISGDSRDHAGAEDDQPLAVVPGELAPAGELGAGRARESRLEPGGTERSLQSSCSTS